MDFSVVAAVGSFAISERVLKPKATALFILGCLLAYDLRTKTHDVTALRVYRGPALVAFTLMMAALSLRTWRRNGVACDELLFLPGTLHGHEHGVEGPLIEMPPTPPSSGSPPMRQHSEPLPHQEGDKATLTSSPEFRRRRTVSNDDDDDTTMHEDGDELPLMPISCEDEPNEGEALLGDGSTHSQSERSWNMEEEENAEGTGNDNRPGAPSTRLQRWQGNHPRLARVGTFFFFRSNTATTPNAEYAPSGPSVFGAALDLCVPVLFNFHVFIVAFNHLKSSPNASETPLQILPITFLSVLIFRTFIPPGRRFRFWNTMKFSFAAPLHKVKFRDEFISEAMTSWVRPGQDIFFALSYYLTVIYGLVSGKYGLTRSGEILEDSWLLHNVILPSFALLPLWLKYLQTLRQAYDANKRWPYQANSIKYLASSMVIIYGIAHPEKRRTARWIIAFLVALLYQICWDVLMDWELFEIRRDIQLVDAEEPDSWCNRISSFRPNSHALLKLHMYVVQPVLDFYQRKRASLPGWGQIQLRSKRLYKTENFYWKIFAANCVMRCAWMLCCIPAYHISRSRTVLTSTSDVNSYWGVLLPAAEIFRRTVWGFLFVERETIKLMENDAKYSKVSQGKEAEDDDEDDDSKFGIRTSFRQQLLPTWLDNQQQVAHNAATSGAKQRDHWMRQLFIFELHCWAAAFIVLGCWAAT